MWCETYVVKVLGIETSCDETAAAVVEDGKKLLSNVVASSMDLHAKYGGVVPEIAARSHIEAINPVIEQALTEANCTWDSIDAIAVTYGAGLGGSLLVGVLAARTAAIIHNKPLYACNHVEGHVYASFLTEAFLSGYEMPNKAPGFPMLALIVSGGHSQLVLFKNHFDYKLLGRTNDDAIGEAFDKVAKILGLPYPGGPSVSKAAIEGYPTKYKFPKARSTLNQGSYVSALRGASDVRTAPHMRYGKGAQKHATKKSATSANRVTGSARQQVGAIRGLGKYDFSFSGLKTAVLRTAQKECGVTHDFPSFELYGRLSEAQKANLAASFQHTAIETVVDKTVEAYEEFAPKSVVIAGGVAANRELRQQLSDRLGFDIPYPDHKLCTDNGAMIASLGCFKMKKNQQTADPYTLDISPNLTM